MSRYLGHRSVTTTEDYYLRFLNDEDRVRVMADGDNGIQDVPERKAKASRKGR